MEEHGAVLRLPRMRTLTEAYACIKEADPKTAITANYVRCLIVSGVIPRMKCGKKYLVDVDLLIEYLRKGAQGIPDTSAANIKNKT
mgnify:CR=1 FL=1